MINKEEDKDFVCILMNTIQLKFCFDSIRRENYQPVILLFNRDGTIDAGFFEVHQANTEIII